MKRCRYRHDPADLAAPVAGSTGDNRHGSASTEGIGGNRNGLGGQRNGSDGTHTARHRGWATRGRTAPHGRLLHGMATVAAVDAAVAQGRVAAAAVEAVLLACLLRGRGPGLVIWRDQLWSPPVAASVGVKVGAQPLAVGVFGSHGGSIGRPVLLTGLVPAPGSGTRYDASVKPGVNKECGSLLPMWHDAVRSLSVDAPAYDDVLGALSINATVCVYMDLVAVLVIAGALPTALVSYCSSSHSLNNEYISTLLPTKTNNPMHLRCSAAQSIEYSYRRST